MPIFIFLISFIFSAYANVMDLNEFFPNRMEDTAVTDVGKFDLQASYHYEDDEEKSTLRPALRYGIMKRVQLEFSNDLINGPEHTEKGSGRTQAGFQWNFNDQDNWVPSIALEPMFIFPTGKDVEGIDPSLRLNLTYTLAGTLTEPIGQFHLNYRWDNNASKKDNEQQIGQLIVFGYGHKVTSKSALLADYVYDRDMYSVETKNEVELGWIWECMKEAFIAVGAGVDIHNGYFNSTLALEKTF